MEFAGIGLYRYNFDGTILGMDEQVFQLLELDGRFTAPAQVAGLNIGDVLQYIDEPGRLRSLVKRDGHLKDYEVHFRTLRGNERYVVYDAYLVEHGPEKVPAIQVIVKDITRLRHAEQAVKDERQELLSVFEAIDEGIYVADPDTHEILYANPELESHFGPLTGKVCHRALQDRSEPCPFCTNDIIFGPDAPAAHIWEHHNRKVDKYYRCIDKVLRWPDGRRVRYEMAVDITDLKRAESTARESEEKYRQLVENATEGIAVTGDGIVLFCNEAAAEIAGKPQEQIISQSILALVHPEDHEKVRYHQSLRTGSSDKLPEYSLRAVRPSGEVRWVHASGVRIQWGGRPATLVFLSDTTERRSLEEQLKQSQKMEAIGRLAGGIAHDFNNLLTIISGYNEMLRARTEDELSASYVEEISKATARAADLTGRLLTFSRKALLQPIVLDVNHVLKDVKAFLQRIIGEDIELRIELTDSLWKTKADPGQIEQVILNLATNARDAMPSGGVLVLETHNAVLDADYAARHAEVAPGNYVMLAVSDTGDGMDEEVLQHIYEPFFTTKGERGTGLGLATVYGIAHQHDGHIWCYSEKGEGTTFKLYLPATEGEMKTRQGTRPSSKLKGSETILIVEDDADILEMSTKMLRRQGYDALAAESGPDALALAAAFDGPIHLLLTDVVMPKMNGRELAERLTSDRPDTRVLYTSGYTENVIAHHGVLDSDIHFIKKPYLMSDLLALIRAILDGD